MLKACVEHLLMNVTFQNTAQGSQSTAQRMILRWTAFLAALVRVTAIMATAQLTSSTAKDFGEQVCMSLLPKSPKLLQDQQTFYKTLESFPRVLCSEAQSGFISGL